MTERTATSADVTAWLLQELSGGPVRPVELRHRALHAGIDTGRLLELAKLRGGIVSVRRGKVWFWSQLADAARKLLAPEHQASSGTLTLADGRHAAAVVITGAAHEHPTDAERDAADLRDVLARADAARTGGAA